MVPEQLCRGGRTGFEGESREPFQGGSCGVWVGTRTGADYFVYVASPGSSTSFRDEHEILPIGHFDVELVPVRESPEQRSTLDLDLDLDIHLETTHRESHGTLA